MKNNGIGLGSVFYEMNEEQKQAVANAKIKLANIWFSGAPDGARGWIGVSLDAVEALAPHAHTSVQNGTADAVITNVCDMPSRRDTCVDCDCWKATANRCG